MRAMELNGTLRAPQGGYGKLNVNLTQAISANIAESPAKTREGKIGGFVEHISDDVRDWMMRCMRAVLPADLMIIYGDPDGRWNRTDVVLIDAFRSGQRAWLIDSRAAMQRAVAASCLG